MRRRSRAEGEPAPEGEAPAEGGAQPAAGGTSPARAQARLRAAIERIGGPEVVREALAPKQDSEGKPMKWSAVCAEQAAGHKPGDPVFTAWARLAVTPVREVKALVITRDDRPGRRGGRRGGPRRYEDDGPREAVAGPEELRRLGRDGSFRSRIRIVHENAPDSTKRDREEERKAERDAKREADQERLKRLGYCGPVRSVPQGGSAQRSAGGRTSARRPRRSGHRRQRRYRPPDRRAPGRGGRGRRRRLRLQRRAGAAACVRHCERRRARGRHRRRPRDAGDTERLADAAARALGPIDILVANAGTGSPTDYQDVDADAFDDVLAVNLRAPFLLARKVLPGMRERGFGRMLFTSSVAALHRRDRRPALRRVEGRPARPHPPPRHARRRRRRHRQRDRPRPDRGHRDASRRPGRTSRRASRSGASAAPRKSPTWRSRSCATAT